MILVYVAGPFSAPTREGVEANIRRAVDLGVEVAKLGAYPVIPHANTADTRFEHVQPYQFWIDATLEMLKPCKALITVEGWEKSSGARNEVLWMTAVKRPVFHVVGELSEYLDGTPPPQPCGARLRWIQAFRGVREFADPDCRSASRPRGAE